MAPLAQVVLVLCAVVLTVAIVVTLSSIRRASGRAETVLQLVEREIRPLASQVEGLAAEVRTLSSTANRELERVSGVVRRVEEIDPASRVRSPEPTRARRGVRPATRVTWRRGLGPRASLVSLHRAVTCGTPP